MIQIINFIKDLLTKYNSLRQEAWTHWLVLVTYLFAIPTIFLYLYALKNCVGILFIVYLFYSVPIYSGLAGAAILFGVINQFQKFKIKNKFLTQNKLYWIYWTIGNILSLWFISFAIRAIYEFNNR